MNCYRVLVKVTNYGRTTQSTMSPHGDYVKCDGGFLYILGNKFSDVEVIVDKDWILSIEKIGEGYFVLSGSLECE